ncbi:MAG: hypothetical protein QM808_11935 [Steroidobacteraceae bacterium]
MKLTNVVMCLLLGAVTVTSAQAKESATATNAMLVVAVTPAVGSVDTHSVGNKNFSNALTNTLVRGEARLAAATPFGDALLMRPLMPSATDSADSQTAVASQSDAWLMLLVASGLVVLQLRRKQKSLPQRPLIG